MKLITRNQLRRKASQGFTLIELLLVLAILAILAGIVLPKMAGRSEDARKQAAVTQISAFKTALNTFEVDNGYYPKGQGGLADLIKQPRDAQNWHGPYLDTDSVPKDPWQHDFIYVCPGKNNPSSYDISSAGPDGQAGNDDDITNWTKR
ncbi:MAG TPA: type II secretion system major pseudopilin GspG [Candidatus Paceibacterota bacterium]|nr:type II secretion system major pseudopilin GspG [Candidatus Paceibacterota bacterium]